MCRWLLATLVMVVAVGCGGASKNVSPTGGASAAVGASKNVSATGVGSAEVRTSSLSAADFAAQAHRICGDRQQQVYQAIQTMLSGEEAYPRSFPSAKFASFYQKTAQIGADAVARLRQLPIPAGQEAQMTSDLAYLTSMVEWTRAAGRAASQPDEASYRALVQKPARTPPTHPVLPEDCLYLSLGPGAGT